MHVLYNTSPLFFLSSTNTHHPTPSSFFPRQITTTPSPLLSFLDKSPPPHPLFFLSSTNHHQLTSLFYFLDKHTPPLPGHHLSLSNTLESIIRIVLLTVKLFHLRSTITTIHYVHTSGRTYRIGYAHDVSMMTTGYRLMVTIYFIF